MKERAAVMALKQDPALMLPLDHILLSKPSSPNPNPKEPLAKPLAIVTMREAHNWIFTKHAAYSAAGRPASPPGDPRLLGTY